MRPLETAPSANPGAIWELTRLLWKLVTSPDARASLRFGRKQLLVSSAVGEGGTDMQTGTCTQTLGLHKPNFLRKPEKPHWKQCIYHCLIKTKQRSAFPVCQLPMAKVFVVGLTTIQCPHMFPILIFSHWLKRPSPLWAEYPWVNTEQVALLIGKAAAKAKLARLKNKQIAQKRLHK